MSWEASVQSQVRFNRVPVKVWEALVSQGSGEDLEKVLGGFGAESGSTVPKKVPEKVWEGSVQSQVRFNRFWRRFVEGLGGFGAEPGQAQQGSEGSGEGLGGVGAEPGQVQQGSGEGLGGFGVTGFRRRFWRRFREALVQSQVRFNRVRRGFGAEPGEV